MQWVGLEAALPFSPAWTIFWIAVLGWSLRRVRFAPHYAVLSGVGLALAAAPLGWLPALDGHPFSLDKWGLLAVAGIHGIAAFFDHRLLKQVMGALPAEDEAAAPGSTT